MLLVVKRDGEIVEFRLEKITMAIQKAFKATDKFYTDDILELLSIRVTSDFQKKIQENRIAVEDVYKRQKETYPLSSTCGCRQSIINETYNRINSTAPHSAHQQRPICAEFETYGKESDPCIKFSLWRTIR